MAESKKHGRRRAEVTKNKSRRLGVLGKRHRNSAGRVTGLAFAATGVILSLAAPSMASTDTMERVGFSTDVSNSDKTSLSPSVIQGVSEFSSRISRVPVTADPSASITFEREAVTSVQSLDRKLEIAAREAALKAAKAKVEADEKTKAEALIAAAGSVSKLTAEHTVPLAKPEESNKSLSAPMKVMNNVSGFGPRMNPITGEAGEIHTGQDFVAQCGTDVLASAGGVVVYTQWHPYGGGNRIEIDHGNGLVTSYNHLESSSVKVGQKIERGDVIAKSGTTGASTGCHLHFEVLVNNEKVDPKGWL